MAYKIKLDDLVANNVTNIAEVRFYRIQVKRDPIASKRVQYLQYRRLFRPTAYDNTIKLKLFESELIKLLVGI